MTSERTQDAQREEARRTYGSGDRITPHAEHSARLLNCPDCQAEYVAERMQRLSGDYRKALAHFTIDGQIMCGVGPQDLNYDTKTTDPESVDCPDCRDHSFTFTDWLDHAAELTRNGGAFTVGQA